MAANEHIFTIAVAVDDDAIREGIIKSCESQIVQNFKKEFYEADYYGRNARPGKKLCEIVDKRVAEVVNENKSEIIDLIVERVSDKIMRSKAFKDKLKTTKDEVTTCEEEV